MAAFTSISSREVSSKIISIWFPTMTFTAIGGEHVVANMFYVPLGIFLEAPKVTVAKYIWKSMLPSVLGNIVGGGLFMGTLYWYLYPTGEEGDQQHGMTSAGINSQHFSPQIVQKGRTL
jgi:formate/nitrite transporter FocA (FNT family)